MSRTPVTMKTIAAELGVSVTTVARALKDGHKVGPDLVKKIRETADRLGYVRNLDGAKLRSGRSMVIMALLTFSEDEEVGDSGSAELLNGIHRRLAGSDYTVRAAPVTEGRGMLDQLGAVIRGRLADGIILDHTELHDPRVEDLLQADFPFVSLGRTVLQSRHAWFDIDNEQAAWQGTDALLRAGYKRVAMIDGEHRLAFARQRERGYLRALRDHGIMPEDGLRHFGRIGADAARQAARGLLDRGADAFLCANDPTCLGALAGIRDRLGDGASRIGMALSSGTNLPDYLDRPCFVSHLPSREAGMRLTYLLLRRIEGAAPRDCQELAAPRLIAAGTRSPQS